MKCPHCVDATLLMTDRRGVEIDYCPQCRGVWLDRGELDKLLERAADAVQPLPIVQAASVAPGMRAPSHDSAGYRDHERGADGKSEYGYRKKKSWLNEIFD
jgi:Zn-finger nucleic acid-binding protein